MRLARGLDRAAKNCRFGDNGPVGTGRGGSQMQFGPWETGQQTGVPSFALLKEDARDDSRKGGGFIQMQWTL